MAAFIFIAASGSVLSDFCLIFLLEQLTLQVSSQIRKETDNIKEKKDKTLQDKKKGKPKSIPVKRRENNTATAIKSISAPSKAASKTVARTLTNAEYEEIFRAVIDVHGSTRDKEDDVYMAPTQHDSQAEHELATDNNIASVGQHKCGSALEDDSDLEGSDKENLQRNEKAAADASDNEQLINESKPKCVKIKNKMHQDTDNGNTKKNNKKLDNSTTKAVAQSKEPNGKETGVQVTEKRQKKKKSVNLRTQDMRKEIMEIDDQNEVSDGKKKEKIFKKERKNKIRNEHGKRRVKDDARAVAKEKVLINKQDTLPVSEDRAEVVSENDNKETSALVRRKGSKKHKPVLITGGENGEIKTNRQESDDTPYKHTEKETDSEKINDSVSDCKESKDGAGLKEDQKEEKHKKREKDKLSRKRNKDEVTSGKTGTKSKESAKTGQCNPESTGKAEKIKTKKAENNIEPKKEMTDEVDHKERQREAEFPSNGQLSKDGEKTEMSCDEKTKYKEEEKDDVESIVSEQSLGSSLLDMEHAVDQWERLEEIQELNEHTPCVSEAEAEAAETNSCTVVHKAKKKKHRENQLAPRKLSYDASASRKKQRLVQECDSDDASSVPAELGTWVQCEAKGCQKWRYLSNIHDPVELPHHWVCSMNKDERYNSCDKSEQDYDESDHIFTQYTLGSIVWVKMDGYPWWPAMVDTDPDCDIE